MDIKRFVSVGLLGLALVLPGPHLARAAEIVRDAALYPSEPILGGLLGTDIALFDDTVVVGNWIEERAYVYRRVGGVWGEQHKFVNNGTSVEFGNAVAVHGEWMAIAARLAARSTNNSGGVPIAVS